MKPRIVFFGTPSYSLIVLDLLYTQGYPIAGVVTKPPRPVGRSQKLTETAVARWGQSHKIPTFQPAAKTDAPWMFNDETELTKNVLALKPDLLIVADFTQKIPQELVKSVPFGGLNIHPSLLPAYRGPAPVPWALFKGEKETGVSVVTLSENFDAGMVIAQEKEKILDTDTTDSLLTRLFTKGAELLIKELPGYISKPPHTLNPHLYPEPSRRASYFPRITRDDGFEPWEKIQVALSQGTHAQRIYNKWRGFHPWPGLWTKIKLKSQIQNPKNQEKRLKIISCQLVPKSLSLDPNPYTLVLISIQLEGKTAVSGNNLKNLLVQIS